jgi:hypothetical protein
MKAHTLHRGIISLSAAAAFTLAACSSPAQSIVPVFNVGDYPGGAWNGNYITGFGIFNSGGDGSVAQTFSINDVPAALVNNIQLPIYGSSSATFQIGIAAWNGSQLTGPMLYLSSPLAGIDGWSTYSLNPNNLVLNQNQQYALFVTPNNFVNTSLTYDTGMGYVPSYSGGQYYQIAGFQLSVNDLFTQGWTGVPAAFAFSVTYQAVPEPAAPALFGFGALALGWRYRASRKST